MATFEKKSYKIKYQGSEFWFLQDEDGSGPIAPLHHCFEDGSLNPDMMFSSETYAHVGQDRIMRRYRQPLCTIDELLNN